MGARTLRPLGPMAGLLSTALAAAIALLAIAPVSAAPPGWTIKTVAGGIGGPGPASTVSIGEPCGLTWSGSTLLAGTFPGGYPSGVIRAVNTTTGRLTNIAGIGFSGSSPDGSPARYARFALSCDAIIDHQGNMVFSDSAYAQVGPRDRTGNQLIRVVAMSTGTFYGQSMHQGDIYTIGGSGQFGFSGDGGPARAAKIGTPLGLAVDEAGNIVFATAWPTGHIRVIAARNGNFYGQAMHAGDIYTIAGGDASAPCEAPHSDGQLATNVQLTLSTMLTRHNKQSYPNGLRIDHEGNVVVTDVGCTGQATVRVVAAGTGSFYGRPYGRTFTAGHIYTVAGGGTIRPGNGVSATSAGLTDLAGLAVDRAGNIVVVATSDEMVLVIAAKTGRFYGQAMTKGRIYKLAGGNGTGSGGDGGPASRSRLDFPSAVAVDGQGNVAIADTRNYRVRLVADKSGRFYGQSMRAGDIYTIAGNGLTSFSGDGGPALAARFGLVFNPAVDAAGDILIGDAGNGRVRFIPATTGTFFGRHMVAGDVRTLAGSPSSKFGEQCLLTFGTGLSKSLQPCWVTYDHSGNAVLTTPVAVKVIARRTGRFYGQAMTAGHVYLLGGTGHSTADGVLATSASMRPAGLAVDSHGNILTGLGKLRVIAARTGTFYGMPMKAGRIYTIGSRVQLLSADRHGNAIVTAGNRVEIVAGSTGTFYGLSMTAGHLYAVAGDGDAAESGDGGPATAAGMDPGSVVIDAQGNIVISDFGPGPGFSQKAVIRVVAQSTGTFYGVSMHKGDIYQIAGGGSSFAEGVAPLTAEILTQPGLAPWPGGGVLEAEGVLGQIRLISQAG